MPVWLSSVLASFLKDVLASAAKWCVDYLNKLKRLKKVATRATQNNQTAEAYEASPTDDLRNQLP